jgi:hypothetical protein
MVTIGGHASTRVKEGEQADSDGACGDRQGFVASRRVRMGHRMGFVALRREHAGRGRAPKP